MLGAALQKWIELDLLKPARRPDALLVAGGNIAGGRGAFGAGLGAFEDDDIAWHDFTGKVRSWKRGGV